MRLIDADALDIKMSEEYGKTAKLIRKGEIHLDSLAEGYTEVRRLVITEPAIDPVMHGYVPSGLYEQVKWERDMAINQLNSCGVQFGEKVQDVQKLKHGKWLNDSGYDDWHCSECGFEINYDGEYPTEYDNFRFCGCCGAEMGGGK